MSLPEFFKLFAKTMLVASKQSRLFDARPLRKGVQLGRVFSKKRRAPFLRVSCTHVRSTPMVPRAVTF